MKRRSVLWMALASIVLLCFQASVPASATLITFDDLAVNSIVTNQYAALGVEFSLIDSPLAGPIVPPESAPSGHFITPSSNYILGAFDYDIEITFTPGANQSSILVMDAEEPFDVLVYLGVNLVGVANKVSLGPGFGGPNYLAEISGVTFDRMIIDLVNDLGSGAGGPEAYDNLSFILTATPVDEPASLWLAGIAIVATCCRKRERATLTLTLRACAGLRLALPPCVPASPVFHHYAASGNLGPLFPSLPT